MRLTYRILIEINMQLLVTCRAARPYSTGAILRTSTCGFACRDTDLRSMWSIGP